MYVPSNPNLLQLFQLVFLALPPFLLERSESQWRPHPGEIWVREIINEWEGEGERERTRERMRERRWEKWMEGEVNRCNRK